MILDPTANAENRLLSQNSALAFNPYFTSCMVQECGIILKKHALNSKMQFWFSMALGHMASLYRSSFQVGFVDFSERFENSPENIRVLYTLPALGLVWRCSDSWHIRVGLSLQKTLFSLNNESDHSHAWSTWCSVEKSF